MSPAVQRTDAAGSPDLVTRLLATRVFVRGLALQAQIGVNADEFNRRQPLLADVELEVAVTGHHHLADTVNYETIVAAAQAILAEGHIALVEDFALRLAQACMEDPRVLRARVRVEKPEALAPRAAAAGVEIILVRGPRRDGRSGRRRG